MAQPIIMDVDKKGDCYLFFTLLVLTANYYECSANFNLFVSKTEVKRLLGLPAELYYVREGVVNEYAMGWTVKVPADVHSIFFNWEAKTKRPVLYNMATWINTTLVGEAIPLLEPYLNISSSGVIPKDSGAFQLNMPCTGLASGEVDVILNLNVTSSRADLKPTVLYFNRKKICLKGVAAENFLPHKGGVKEAPSSVPAEEEEEQVWLPFFTYVISVVTSLVLVISVILAVACWKYKINAKRKKCTFPNNRSPLFIASSQIEVKPSENKTQFTHLEAPYAGPSPMGTYTAPSNVTGNSYASVYKFPFQSTELTVGVGTSSRQCKCTESTCSGLYESSCYSSSNCNSGTPQSRSENGSSSNKESRNSVGNREEEGRMSLKHLECKFDRSCDRLTLGRCSDVSTLKERFKMLQMDRERVRLTEVVQEGRRGRIYKGWLQREHPELDQQVWIKTLKEGSQPLDIDAFCQEATLLLGLRHHNLMNLVGMSFAPLSPPFLIFPDPSGINLKIYLQTSRPLKVLDLVEIYLEASHGLSFMHAKNIAHGDIAARNCIISDNLHLRLTDSSLAMDLFPEDYEGPTQRPVRWLAPEVLGGKEDKSPLTDMWSLGVLLWELTTPGEHPYYGMNHEHIYGSLLTGLRLRQLFSCPDELYQLMNACWNLLPQRRPSAQKSIEFLSSFKQSLQSFV